MIRRCAPALLSTYVSVIEVGDAYAVRFRALLDFLGVRTLVVNDLDSVDPNDGGRACPTDVVNAMTSNNTLKQWLPGEKSVRTLLELDAVSKSRDHVRVAYQVPERDDGPCGRSFEDAFILANAEVLARNLSPGFDVIRRPGGSNLGSDLGGHGWDRLEGVSLGGCIPAGQRGVR